MNDQPMRCGDCGRMAEDGKEIAARGSVLAYLCESCWYEFLGEMAPDINGVDL